MPELSTILAAAACALIGSAFPGFLFERALKGGTRAKVSLSAGMVSIFSSFILMSLAQLAVFCLASEKALVFGCAMVAFFLLFWAVEAVRAWRAANSGPDQA